MLSSIWQEYSLVIKIYMFQWYMTDAPNISLFEKVTRSFGFFAEDCLSLKQTQHENLLKLIYGK